MRTVAVSRLGHLADLAPLALRLGVGTVFAWHGWQKFTNDPATFATFLDSLGVPLPEVTAWLQTFAEGIGGLLLIVGALTRLTTLPLIGILVGAILLVKDEVGFIAPPGGGAGAELDVSLLAGLVALLFLGPGRLSVDAALGLEHPVATVRKLDPEEARP